MTATCPPDWVLVPLREIATVVRGIAFPKEAKAAGPSTGLVACLRTSNVQREVEWQDVWYVPTRYVRRDDQYLAVGDILISTANSLELVGKVAPVRRIPQRATLGAFIAAIRVREPVVPLFVYYQLTSPASRTAIRSTASTTTNISNISTSKLADLPIAVAPLAQQDRIVAEIEKHFTRLDAAVAALKRVQANLKRYRAAVLKAAVEGRLVRTEADLARAEGRACESASVLLKRILEERRRRWKAEGGRGTYKEPAAPDTTDLPRLPEGWCWASTDQLVVRPICYGVLKAGPHCESGVPLVRVTDIVAGDLSLESLKRCNPEREAVFARARLRAGDVLVSKDGSIGYVALVPAWLDGANITQHVLRLSLAPDLVVAYMIDALRSPHCQSWMKGETRGVALQGVNVEDFRRMPVALPPLSEQARLADEVDRNLSVSGAVERTGQKAVARALRLRRSILSWTFTGHLAEQVPTDEPAGMFLKLVQSDNQANAAARPVARRPVRHPRRRGRTNSPSQQRR